MNDFQFRLEGADGLLARLKKFPDKLQQAAGRKSARKAMAIVRKAAQVAAKALDDRESSERIWKNVYLQQSRRQSKTVGGVVMRVGIRGGAKQYVFNFRNVKKGRIDQSGANAKSYFVGGDHGNPGGDTWYWRHVELGTEKMPARPFLRQSFENNVSAVTSTLITELNREIDQISQER
jgi:HK97 gp10 family phage protein